jgi:DNA-binding transcriptional regulator YiaG
MGLTLDNALERALEHARLRRRLPDPASRRSLRGRAGLTQGDLARALSVDRATISRWESGQRDPDRDHLASYVDLLDRLAGELSR